MKRILLVVFLAMLLPMSLLAQSSGKIAGVVTDKSSGEPLPGVNVVIDGTSFGAATDEDGYYVIMNVPVSTYKITASFIGYTSVAMSNLKISAGITTEANYQLEATQLELGEAIIIVAERPLVEKNVTQSVSLVTSEELETIPIRGLAGIAATQTSVVIQDGNIHIRGGRDDEVGFYFEGASTSSPLNNMNRVHVIQEALEEFQVLTGGYTAEFGDANSGIVRSELKTGSDNIHVSMDFQTDKFADAGEKFLGTYSYRHHNFVTTIGGPLLGNKIRYFLAWENRDQGDSEIRFSEGFERLQLLDENPENASEHNVVDLVYPSGYTPDSRFKENAFNGSLLFDFQPVRFRVGMAYQDTKNQFDNDQPILHMLNDRDFWNNTDVLLLTAKITHVLSPTTLYEARFGYFNRNFERTDDYFGNDWMKWADSSAVADYTLAEYGEDGQVNYPSDTYNTNYWYKLGGIDFERNGDLPSVFYQKTQEQYLGGGIDFTSQMGRHHEVKAGFDVKKYNLRSFTANTRVSQTFAADDEEFDDVRLGQWADYLQTAYGYDWYGNEIDGGREYFTHPLDSLNQYPYYLDGPKQPLFAAVYIQDKIEYNDLIINAGLRFDYFDTDDYDIPDFDEIERMPLTEFPAQDVFQEMDPFMFVSPRLGFSFPVSSKTVFYSQYGKFVQKPPLGDSYWGPLQYKRQVVGAGNFYTIPIGFGLEPIRTTSYEIGFKQQLSNSASMEMAGFYKNVKGQILTERISPDPDSGIQSFNARVNGDFATTKGFEFKIKTRRINRVFTQFNYTYTVAEGTGEDATSHIAAAEVASPKPTAVSPMSFNQKHRGSIMFDYRFGMKDGGPIMSGFGANLLFQFNSGHPFTRSGIDGLGQVTAYDAGTDYMNDTRTRFALEPLGASTTPWNYMFDMKIDKQMRIMDKVDLTVYMRVLNVFNTQNVNHVFQTTGNAENDGLLSHPNAQAWIDTYGADYIYLYQKINLANGQSYWDSTGDELYGNPRQIFFGVKFSY